MSEHIDSPEPLTCTPLWTLDELCAKLHTSPRTVHGWRRTGTAPKAYKVGKHLMFEEAEIRAWLEARQTASTTADLAGREAETGW
ncbi:helix-turn-helix transcriptional regulator [Georgenia yuyongxinii]|nr:helix-turn-helix domain-containing protein [Georgenia yuyongxinii]